jgi:hypothetical protein
MVAFGIPIIAAVLQCLPATPLFGRKSFLETCSAIAKIIENSKRWDGHTG